MAKKKHNTKRPSTRRRGRVSGIGSANMNQIMGLVVGAVVSPYVDGLLEKAKITDKKMKAGAKAAVGLFLIPKFVKNPIAVSAGHGMLAFSALQLASDLGLYKNGAGIGASDDVYVDLSEINGVDGDTILGIDDDGDNVGEYPATILGVDDEA